MACDLANLLVHPRKSSRHELIASHRRGAGQTGPRP